MPHTDSVGGRRFDVFLSYHAADRHAVERVAQQLRRHRLEPWWDRWHLTPGSSWQEEILEGLRESRACAVMVGPSGLGVWVREELAVAQDQAAKDRSFRIFMVLLPGAPELSDPSLAFLRTRTWVDLRGGVGDPDGLQDLISAVTGAPRHRAVAVASPDTCPYRGLEAFGEEHAPFFFGRDHDIALAMVKLSGSRFLAVLGPSGSGKSSLLRAGIVPALRRGALPGSEGWTIRTLTPGPRPLTTLVAQLTGLFPGKPMQQTLDELWGDPRTLDLAASLGLAERPAGDRLVLVVDQLEEVFTLCREEAERTAFLASLVYAATVPGGRVVVVVGMRADFYHRAAAYPDLRSAVADEQFLVGPLDVEGLRRVIEEPAQSVNLELEAGLVETILADVGGRQGTLPLLEHVLLEVWRRRRGTMLTLEAYVASGRLEGALAQRANEIYSAFTPAQQEVTRRVLLRLIEPGEATEDTRRRAEMEELFPATEDDADVEVVVTALADQRLVTVGRDEISGRRVVDITHEALIRGWPKLQAWINEDREALRAHRRLTDAATEWDRSGRDEGLLYRGARLALWQERSAEHLNDFERAFLDASRQREERERASARRRLRVAVGSLSLALLAISAVAVVALSLGNRAADERDIARSRQLATSAAAQLSINPELSVLLAIRAIETRRTPQAEAVLRQATLESTVKATLRGHQGAANSASFSPDGQRVVSAGDDGTVRVWELGTGREQVVLQSNDAPVYAASFSPDGQRVVSAGDDGTVRVWELGTGREEVVLQSNDAPVYAASFSPDGQRVVSAGDDGTVRVWELGTGREQVTLEGHTAAVWGLGLSPDSRYVASGSDDGSVRLWDLMGNDSLVFTGHSGPVQAVAFSPDAQRVVSTGEDATVRVWDLEGGEPVILEGHVGLTNSVAFSADGGRVVSAGGDGSVRIWEWAGAGHPVVLRGHSGVVAHAELSPDGATVASAGADGTVRLWRSSRPGERFVLRGHTDAVTGAEFRPDGRSVVTGSVDGSVRIWDLLDGTTHPIGMHEGPVIAIALSPHDDYVVTGSEDTTVRVWDLGGGTEAVATHQTPGKVWTVAFSPDGRHVVAAGEDGIVRVWDWRSDEPPAELEAHQGDVFASAFSPDGSLLASGGVDGELRLWSVARKEEPRTVSGHTGSIFSVAFSPDSRRLVSTSDDATVRVWDLSAGEQPVVIPGHQGPPWKAAFSPDGRLVASAGDDSTVRVWNVARNQEPVVLRGHLDPVRTVRFSHDGTFLVTGGDDFTVRIWDCQECRLSVDELLTLARSRVTRSLTPEERRTF